MNIKIDIEMTPEELRRFFGLPDVAHMQDAIMDRMKETIVSKMGEQGCAGWLQLPPHALRLTRQRIDAARCEAAASAHRQGEQSTPQWRQAVIHNRSLQ